MKLVLYLALRNRKGPFEFCGFGVTCFLFILRVMLFHDRLMLPILATHLVLRCFCRNLSADILESLFSRALLALFFCLSFRKFFTPLGVNFCNLRQFFCPLL